MDVNGLALDAVVDTGADVSVLSKEAYQLMEPRLPVKECITMLQAGKDSEIEGFIAGPFNILISPYNEADLQVTPLKDRMLLCLDVLFDRRVRLDLGSGAMELCDENIMKDLKLYVYH